MLRPFHPSPPHSRISFYLPPYPETQAHVHACREIPQVGEILRSLREQPLSLSLPIDDVVLEEQGAHSLVDHGGDEPAVHRGVEPVDPRAEIEDKRCGLGEEWQVGVRNGNVRTGIRGGGEWVLVESHELRDGRLVVERAPE